MPFTLSHAAAVLPFRRTRLPWSALVIGSFGPDFEYFLRMNYGSRAWHHYPDVLVYCLPFTLLVYFAFHAFVRQPLLELMPGSIRARLTPARHAAPRSFADSFFVIGALLVGIATHLLWDSLTHAASWPWAHLSLLRRSFHVPYVGNVYGFAIAQATSTLLGIVLLSVALWRWHDHTMPGSRTSSLSKTARFFILFGMGILAIAGSAWRTVHVLGSQHALQSGSLKRLLFVIAAIGCVLWELLAYGIVMSLSHKYKHTSG